MLDRKTAVECCYLIPGWCWPQELGQIYDLILKKKPRVHVEIGSFCGRSLYVASCAMPNYSTVYSVEPFILGEDIPRYIPDNTWLRNVYGETLRSIRLARPDLNLVSLNESSITAALSLKQRDVKIDSVYIDGSHHYSDVCADIGCWLPLMNSSGLMFGHDYWARDPGVMDGVSGMLPDFEVLPNSRIWMHTTNV